MLSNHLDARQLDREPPPRQGGAAHDRRLYKGWGRQDPVLLRFRMRPLAPSLGLEALLWVLLQVASEGLLWALLQVPPEGLPWVLPELEVPLEAPLEVLPGALELLEGLPLLHLWVWLLGVHLEPQPTHQVEASQDGI